MKLKENILYRMLHIKPILLGRLSGRKKTYTYTDVTDHLLYILLATTYSLGVLLRLEFARVNSHAEAFIIQRGKILDEDIFFIH